MQKMHSPDPWRLDEAENGYLLRDASGDSIAAIAGSTGDHPADEQHANAVLMKLAPKMAYLLEVCAEQFETIATKMDGDDEELGAWDTGETGDTSEPERMRTAEIRALLAEVDSTPRATEPSDASTGLLAAARGVLQMVQTYAEDQCNRADGDPDEAYRLLQEFEAAIDAASDSGK